MYFKGLSIYFIKSSYFYSLSEKRLDKYLIYDVVLWKNTNIYFFSWKYLFFKYNLWCIFKFILFISNRDLKIKFDWNSN